jgi:hypothetical protein
MRHALLLSIALAGALTGALAGALAGCSGGRSRVGDGGCQGLACDIVDCSGRAPTSLSGVVTAPNGLDPVPGALVYIPSAMTSFAPGVQCEACATSLPEIVSTTTALDGSFQLANVPATQQLPVIVQKGRFRKQVKVDTVACADRHLTVDEARLPRNQSEGDLPHIAVGVGDYDQIECVLRAIGIDTGEFTPPDTNGAVHLYNNSGGTPSLESMLSSATSLDKYNLVFVNCTSQTFDLYGSQSMVKANLHDFVQKGGRLYVTDWAYDYMEQVPAFAPYIFFDGGGDLTTPQPLKGADLIWSGAPIAATVADADLAAWLKAANASPDGSVSLEGAWALARSTAMDQGLYPSTTWVHGSAAGLDRPMTVTFDYDGCGKVLWSAYHTRQPGGGMQGTINFPAYCKSTPSTMIAQEKILEYLIFEFSSCVGPVM